MPTKATFTAKCDRCKQRKAGCATCYRAFSSILNRWASEPDTLCFDCRRELQPNIRLDAKHQPARLRRVAPLPTR